jgi:hypothetical protein
MGVESRKSVDKWSFFEVTIFFFSPPSNCGGTGWSDSELQLVREPGGLTGYLERHGAWDCCTAKTDGKFCFLFFSPFHSVDCKHVITWMGINQFVLEKIYVMFQSVSELRAGRVDTNGIWRFAYTLRVWGPRIDNFSELLMLIGVLVGSVLLRHNLRNDKRHLWIH